MFKKVSVVLGALALVAVASQGFVANEAAAKRNGGLYVCHFSNDGSKSKVVRVNDWGAEGGALWEHTRDDHPADTEFVDYHSNNWDFQTDADGNDNNVSDGESGNCYD